MAGGTILQDIHSCQVRVLYGDTDSGGVVYYGNYLRYFERGRTEFMRDQGITYKSLEEAGLILPVVENYCRYKAPAKYDDLIDIHTQLVEIKKISCRFNYQIRRSADKRLLVKGHTLHAVVDRKGKLSKFPAEVFAKLKNMCQETS